jgi:sulfite reductase alpha subunit-like flavoprotein
MKEEQKNTNKPQFVILYGSQSGNAQDLAERTWRQAKQLNFSALLCSMNDYDLNRINTDDLILFICSTTGQGDVPDNMSQFWKALMRKNLPLNCLNNLNFFLLGLGDSNYPKFNFVAKKLFKRLIQLEATALSEACLCDDQNSDGFEGTYTNWMKNVWKRLDIIDSPCLDSTIFPHIYNVSFINDSSGPTDVEIQNEDELATESKPFYARITRNERMTTEKHWQNVRLFEFDCSHTKQMTYEAGDVLMIKPKNIEKFKQRFLNLFSHLNLNLDQKIEIKCNFPDEIVDKESKLSSIRTINELVESYFDFNSVPRMTFFELFSNYATNELEKEKLLEFQSREGREDLYDYCYRPRRTILEIFADFPQTTLNIRQLEDLLNLIPGLKPRAFSIASSPTANEGKIQLLVAVVEYKTRIFETRLGTCSNWLASVDASSSIYAPVWIKKGSFSLDWSKPVICIGPGTGVAPFRSIINERIKKYKINDNYLYFGSRSRNADFYFENEWTDFVKSNEMKLYTAFSRDQDDKVYVQDELLKNSIEVFQLIDKFDAYIYIAGNSKRMPEDVLEILRQIIEKHADFDGDKKVYSDDYIKRLDAKRRIQLETWS